MSNRHLFMPSGFARAPFGLGIGRYVCQLQRITLKFCKSHGDSRGLREFMENDLIDFAKENPGVVVYVKPRRHRSPVLKAEYLNGETHWLSVSKYSRDDIVQWMELMRTQFHNGSTMRLRKLWHTEFPSIQGPWTPVTFAHPSVNTMTFPNKELGLAEKFQPTATEEILRLYEEQKQSESNPKIEVQERAV